MVSLVHSILYHQQNGKCHYCGDDMSIGGNEKTGWSIDHKIPRLKGGNNDPDNLVLCCRSCNSTKRLIEYDTFYTIAKLYRIYGESISMSDWAKSVKKAYELYSLYPEISPADALIAVLQGRDKEFGRTTTFDNFVIELAKELGVEK